jgi:hypothetical protein
MDQAKRVGIVVCKHCGYPPNNHFSENKGSCAHDNACPGYEPRFTMGKEIKHG